MGIVSDLNAWHRAEVWLDRTRAKVGCKLDQVQSGYAPGSFVLPNGLKAFGLQLGEITVAPNLTAELNIDNALLDGNPPM